MNPSGLAGSCASLAAESSKVESDGAKHQRLTTDIGVADGVNEEKAWSGDGDLGRALAPLDLVGHNQIRGGGEASLDDYAAWGIAAPLDNEDVTGPITTVTGARVVHCPPPFFYPTTLVPNDLDFHVFLVFKGH